MPVRAIRGATTLDSDSPEQVNSRVHALMSAIMERNGLVPEDLISVLFTSTPDVASMFPATAARGLREFSQVPLMGAQEIEVKGALQRCIRVMVHVETDLPPGQVRHV